MKEGAGGAGMLLEEINISERVYCFREKAASPNWNMYTKHQWKRICVYVCVGGERFTKQQRKYPSLIYLICVGKSQRQMLEYHLNAFGCWLAWQASRLALVGSQAVPILIITLFHSTLSACSIVNLLFFIVFSFFFLNKHFIFVCLVAFSPRGKMCLRKQYWDVEINIRVASRV